MTTSRGSACASLPAMATSSRACSWMPDRSSITSSNHRGWPTTQIHAQSGSAPVALTAAASAGADSATAFPTNAVRIDDDMLACYRSGFRESASRHRRGRCRHRPRSHPRERQFLISYQRNYHAAYLRSRDQMHPWQNRNRAFALIPPRNRSSWTLVRLCMRPQFNNRIARLSLHDLTLPRRLQCPPTPKLPALLLWASGIGHRYLDAKSGNVLAGALR